MDVDQIQKAGRLKIGTRENSKPSNRRGRKIRSVGDFEKSNADMFYVNFGKEVLRHRGWLISLQYKTLKQIIERGMREAIKENKDD